MREFSIISNDNSTNVREEYSKYFYTIGPRGRMLTFRTECAKTMRPCDHIKPYSYCTSTQKLRYQTN